MTEAEEKEIDRMNKGRILREAGKELIPLLERMREDVITRISHGQGTELTAQAAELRVIDQLRAKFTRSNRETEKLEGKLYGRDDRE